MKLWLDTLLDCRDGREGGSEVLGGVEKWIMPSNWKFPSENFAGDGYHNISHRSVDMVGIGPSGRGRRDESEYAMAQRVNASLPELGHAAVGDLQAKNASYVPTYQNTSTAEEYFKRCFQERQQPVGEGADYLGLVGTVFPNMSYLARQPRSISVWHPRGPHQTEAWRWFLVDRDAPEEVKDILRQYFIRYSGPAGMTEQDDMENWNYAHSASRGVIARRHPYNYEMGLNRAPSELSVPGTVVMEQICEQNARGFYNRWAQLMEARSWDDALPNGHLVSARNNGRNGNDRR